MIPEDKKKINTLDRLIRKLRKAQDALRDRKIGIIRLEQLSAETKKAFDAAIDYTIGKRNIRKEIEARREQLKHWKRGILAMAFPINWKYFLSMPFIYGMIVPAVFFHLCIEIYHQFCFRLYGIPLVKGNDYFVYDRQLLPYLKLWEKANCIYCSYVNNLIRYSAEIGGRTERYWCPIKYARRIDDVHSHYPKFVDYLDAKKFREKWEELRDFSDVAEEKTGEERKKENKADKQA